MISSSTHNYVNKTIDIFKFLLYNVMETIAFWCLLEYSIIFDAKIGKLTSNFIINYLIYISTTFLIVWFCTVSIENIKWKPFGRYTRMSSVAIYIITIVILICKMRMPKVNF